MILRNVAREWGRSAAARVRLTCVGESGLTDVAGDVGADLAPLPPMTACDTG